jgi:succinyl-diaminopimelate desuccinylase, proteobacterial clade
MADFTNMVDPIELTQALIRCPSITPLEAGALDVVQGVLTSLGFSCHRVPFGEAGPGRVDNLYARFGSEQPNLCFAGHVDVVPPGALDTWSVDPFSATIENGRLFGRGAADMKAAIASFVAAVAAFLDERGPNLHGSLSLLLTCDEEGPAVDGTVRVLQWLVARNEQLDACIVGEPTNPRVLGEMIKIGRRGSLNAWMTVLGIQGHAAYPELADNPIPKLLNVLRTLQSTPLDNGSKYFQPSTLTITSVDVGNPVTNLIPSEARAQLNIRFNDLHTASSLRAWLDEACAGSAGRHALRVECSGEAFVTEPGRLTDLMMAAVRRVTGRKPQLSTSGGTSDARFIKDHCPVVEFGMTTETAHKVDESVALDDILALTAIYRATLHAYFDRRSTCRV